MEKEQLKAKRGKRATVRFNSRTNRSNRDSETSSRRQGLGAAAYMGKTTTKAAWMVDWDRRSASSTWTK